MGGFAARTGFSHVLFGAGMGSAMTSGLVPSSRRKSLTRCQFSHSGLWLMSLELVTPDGGKTNTVEITRAKLQLAHR
jgi:hypothetical protein